MCRKERDEGCQKPEKLTNPPAECSPEKIRQCHGGQKHHPCCHPRVETPGCEQPERLKGRPGDCSPEQIRICHGDGAEHPCEPR
jgi:hypothetical protein